MLIIKNYKELHRIECNLMVSSVVYSVHSILSNSLYLVLVELLLLSAGGVIVTLWGLSYCYFVGFELLLLCGV